MKRICFIINPVSGVGRQKVIEKLIDEHLDRTLFSYEVAYANAPKHATELAGNAASRNFDIVVAVGGDGSVNETAKGLIGTSTAMAIIPTGSGNGLARYLKIPMDLEKAMEVINRTNKRVIDTVKFNSEKFVNVAGIGFDAHIGWEFAKFGKRGFSSYLKVIMREFPKYKPKEYQLLIDGKKYTEKAFLISFANGSQWGNNAHIAPTADAADGWIDVAILKDINFVNGISVAYRLFNKKLDRSSALKIIKGKKIEVIQEATIAHIDGEPIEVGNKIQIEVDPLSLNIIVP